MSQDTPQAAPEAVDAPPPPRDRSKALFFGVVGAAVLLGGTVGAMVLAPRTRPAPAPVVDTVRTADGAPVTDAGFTPGPQVRFDNMIVNPAGSQGARFLMVSLAVEAADAKIETALRSREAQVRDLVIGLLERQTMDDLSRVGARDSIRRQLTDTLGTILASRGKIRVWLPQFVVQ